MKKGLILLLFLISILFLPSFSYASVFTTAYLRLDSQKPNTALSGMVCAQPSSASGSTEAKVVIAFPSDFTISQTTSNWTTSTNNLPSGATAWPGIGSTASNVSNQGVTFNSSDLTSSTLYCFNFTGASSTTGSTGNDKQGTISTKNSSGTSVDLTPYAVSIVSNDNISVTASVDPKISDLQATLTSLDTETQFNQNTTLTYRLTYGSSLSSTFPITFEADWTQGTIQGNSSPSVDILEYVTGSADSGINSVSPVIDTVNKKITWTYSNFPANSTNNTLTFKLRTNSSYTGGSQVNFTVSSKATANSTVTTDSAVNQSYIYNSSLNPTSTPTPTSSSSTNSTTATPTITPTPTPTLTNTFDTLEIRTISQDSASVYVQTNLSSKATVYYGTSVNNLNKTVSFSDFSLTKNLKLTDLLPNTQYFFVVRSTDSSGKTISSDIFTFTTASAPPALINENSIVIVSKNNIIYDTTGVANGAKKENFVVIPINTNFQIKFSFKTTQTIKKIKIIVRKQSDSKNKRKVLGFNNFTQEADAASNNVSLVEVKPGEFTATIKSNIEPGIYDLLVGFEDENGNLDEQKISNLVVTNPLTIVDADSEDEPIEGARVLLYIYNQKERIFVPLSSSSLNIANPSFSDHYGHVNLVLPKATYKATITDIRFKEKSVVFTIEDSDQTNYPIIKLYHENLSILSIIRYFYNSFNDVFLQTTLQYIAILNVSLRFFDLIAASTLFAFVSITLFAFSKKHHIPLSSLVSYFFYLINHRERNNKYINGAVFDTKGAPIYQANVYLTDIESEQIIKSTKTNNKGEFFFPKGQGKYNLMIMKKGYEQTPQIPYEEKTDVALKITLEEHNLQTQIRDRINHFISNFIGTWFETLLLFSLVFEFLFIPNFGFKTVPFIIISLFNFSLWILHRKNYLNTN